MKHIQMLIPTVCFLACTANIIAQDWPQFLGPSRDAISSEKGIMRAWPESGPEVLWTIDVGRGFGGPVIKDGKVYLLDRDDQTGDFLRCLNLSNGEEHWRYAYDAPGSVSYPGSRSIPAIDGNNVYSCGPYGDLYCINISTQKPVWNKNVWKEYGGGDRVPRWAITQNPLIYGDLCIVASQAPQAGVVAFDKRTGDVKWKTPSLGAVGYVSPSIAKVSGEEHLIMITAASGGRGQAPSGGRTVGIKPETGKILWDYTNWNCRIPIPTAVDAGEGRMLITGGYEAGCAMIQVEKKEDGSYSVKELYKNLEFGTHTLPPILYKDHFYAQYSTNERRDGLVCMSMDGEIKWKTKREPLFDKGSMILVDDLLICTDGNQNLCLVEPDPSAFKSLATAQLLNRGQNWSPLALSGGKLLIRDQGQLKCIKIVE